jgi:protein-tyrosine-phosphatase
MSGWMKEGLPLSKTFTMGEFAGGSGDISDPFGQGINTYLQIADELSEAIDKIIPKLLK